MIRHQLLLIYRNCKRYKSTFLINLAGLSTALACVVLIGLWVNDELQMDKFHEKDQQLYQVLSVHNFNNELVTAKATSWKLEQSLVEELPEVQQLAVFVNYGDNVSLSVDDKTVRGQGKFGSNDFFKVFSFPLLSGSNDQVLVNKDAIAISEDLALGLFNTTEGLLGKTITVYQEDYAITGIFENIPNQSSLQFDFMLSYEGLKAKFPDSFTGWGNTGPRTFIVLEEQTNLSQFKSKIKDFVLSKDTNANTTLLIQPYSETYLYGNYENGQIQAGRMVYVNMFILIAVFILIIACINFMNLFTANASRRTKEVGIKKAIGSSRTGLIYQYLGESISLVFLSLTVALVVVFLLLPRFNLITGKQLFLDLEPSLLFIVLGMALLTGLLAGSYPAFYLSGFQPILILKGKLQSTFGEVWTRKGLVVFQFAISVVFIVSVLVVQQQIDFVQTKNLGYNKSNVVYFEAEGKIKENKEAFLSELKTIPGINNAAATEHHLMGHEHRTGGVIWEGKSEDANISFEYGMIGYELIETLGMEVAQGRSFSAEYGDEKAKIIFNETAIRAMGLQDPVGQIIQQWGEEKEIIGVLKDFHFESFHETVKPMFFVFDPAASTHVMARIVPGSENETLEAIEKLYAKFNPDLTFNYGFLDQDYQMLYESELKVSVLSKYFAGLAVLISCLGLLGLAQFTADRRIKEIGIRKILGASVVGIIRLLAGQFTRLVLMAVIIAIPVSYFITDKWLQTFAFRISLTWSTFVIAGMIALGIAWLTISLQTFKAATVNPTGCLRDE